MKVYAGIGSRNTPTPILQTMTSIATKLSKTGWLLRSGHAPGADQAFEQGAGINAEVFLPWQDFEKQITIVANSIYDKPTRSAYELTSKYHPYWNNLSIGSKALIARDAHQVLGWDLKSPIKFVLCWTKDQSLNGSKQSSGGTGQALRIAATHNIPVYNLSIEAHLQKINLWLSQ